MFQTELENITLKNVLVLGFPTGDWGIEKLSNLPKAAK